MSGISLTIAVEKPGKTYECGELVRGEVKVAVERDYPAAALMAVIFCKGFSESKRFKATTERENVEVKLFKGSWTMGAYVYPFEIPVPYGPITYKGHVFDVTWHLGARARASEEEDSRAETEITVLPAKRAPDAGRPEKSGEAVCTESARGLKGFFIFSILLFFVGLFVGWRNSPFAENTDMGLFFFGGVIPMVLGLALLFFTTWQALVNKRIKKVEVKLGSRQAHSGGKIPCSVTFYSNLPFEVEKVRAILTAEEIVDFRSPSRGDGGKFLKHLLYEASQELPLAVKQVPVNVAVQVQGDISVPVNIPCSINLMESEKGMAVRWRIEFRIEMKRWPDWMHLEDITVVP